MSHVRVTAAAHTVPHCFCDSTPNKRQCACHKRPHRTNSNKRMQASSVPQTTGCVRWCKQRALSVSISAKLSPAATSSPTFFFHAAMFPGPQSCIIKWVS